MKKQILCLVLCNIISYGSFAATNQQSADDELPKAPYCGIFAGKKEFTRLVHNGDIAEEDEFPWVVALSKVEGKASMCTGTLINPRWILTAAHCIKHSNYARFGDNNDFFIDKLIPHPHYKVSTLVFDIALAHLSRSIEYTKQRQPICLPFYPIEITEGLPAIIAGWGRFGEPHKKTSYLRKSTMKIGALSVCNKILQDVKVPDQLNKTYHICAVDANKGGCRGDSGGPFMLPENQNYYQIGVSTNAKLHCRASPEPSVFENVQSHIQWISDSIKNYI